MQGKLIAAALVAALALPAGLAAPVGVETLRGGSFEGLEGYVQSGWQLSFRGGSEVVNELDCADPTACDVAHTGVQAVNLGKVKANHVGNGIALGKVHAIPATLAYAGPEIMPGLPEAATSGVRFADINGASVWSRAGGAMPANDIALEIIFEVRTEVFEQAFPPLLPADASYCLVPWDSLWPTNDGEWTQLGITREDQYLALDGHCARWVAGPMTLGELQEDPRFADGTLTAVMVQSIPAHPGWLGPALYVDDLSVTVLPAAAPSLA